MIWGGLPYYADDVNAIIEATSATYLKTNSDDKIDYIEERLLTLKNLRQTLEASEEAFYTILNIDGATSKEKIKNLQNRIDEINNANGKFSVENFIKNFLSDPTVVSMLDEITTSAVDAALSSIEWTFKDVSGTTEEELISGIIKEFSDKIHRNNEKGNYSNYFTNVEKQGLQRILKVERIINTNEEYFRISIKEGQKVSSDLKNKLLEVIRRTTHTRLAETKNQFKEAVVKKILEYTKSSSSLMASCLRHEVYVNAEKYDLTRSLSSLKGFLQEVWSNAMLSCLFGKPGFSTPTGNIKNLIDNKAQIPIDAVLKNFNFQIKSFTLENGKYEINENNKEIATFITNRAQISNSELLVLFFGSYQFNQPFTNEEYQTDNMTIEEYTNNIYDKFRQISSQFEPLFQSYVDKIVRIDNVFRGDRGYLFGKEKLYLILFLSLIINLFRPLQWLMA